MEPELIKRYEKGALWRIDCICPDCGFERRVTSSSPRTKHSRCRSCAEKAKWPDGRYVSCKECRKETWRPGSRLESRFCSNLCQGKHQRQSRLGAGNPNFRHGKRRNQHFVGWSAREKGERACRVCGSDQSLHLHHAIPRSKWKDGKADTRNGITLCAKCHMRWHAGHRKIYRDHFTSEEWEFMSSAVLTGEMTDAWLERHYPERPTE